MTKDEMKNKISMALKDPFLQQGFEIICKENAELKKENEELNKKYVKNICDCDICDTYCNSQLIKAKEIIEKVSKMYRYSPRVEEIIAEAEQFINSEVEK